jgi:hypothetical protein
MRDVLIVALRERGENDRLQPLARSVKNDLAGEDGLARARRAHDNREGGAIQSTSKDRIKPGQTGWQYGIGFCHRCIFLI